MRFTAQSAAQRALADAAPVTVGRFVVAAEPCSLEVSNPLYRQLLDMRLFDRPHRDGTIETRVSKVRIGDVVLVNFPGEVLPGLVAEDYVPASGQELFLTMCDDNLGYLIPEAEFAPKEDPFNAAGAFVGHEGESLGPHAGRVLIDAANRIGV